MQEKEITKHLTVFLQLLHSQSIKYANFTLCSGSFCYHKVITKFTSHVKHFLYIVTLYT